MSDVIQNTAVELTEYKASQGQINIDEAQGIVEAFVAGIGNKDSVGDIIVAGAFSESLKRRKPRVVWGHDWNSPIGKVLEIYEVPRTDQRLPAKMRNAGIGGLYVRVQFNLKSERGRQAFADVSFFGEEQEWSIGYKTLDADFDPAKNANVLKKVELYEVSPVLHGANQLTGTISIKADKPLKDPKGGLTAAGRAHFNRTEGSNLKPGVKGPADTPEKMRRKGSFLTRFFTNPSGPMKDEKGRPTRLALSAAAWGEPVPSDREAAAKLAAKGRRLLERYENSKKKKKSFDIEEVDLKNLGATIGQQTGASGGGQQVDGDGDGYVASVPGGPDDTPVRKRNDNNGKSKKKKPKYKPGYILEDRNGQLQQYDGKPPKNKPYIRERQDGSLHKFRPSTSQSIHEHTDGSLHIYDDDKSYDIDEMYKIAEQTVLADEAFKKEQKTFVLQSLQEKGITPTPKMHMRPEFERLMRARMMEDFKKRRVMAMLAQMMENQEDEDEDDREEREDDDSVEASNPALGRGPNLPSALAKKFGGQVRIRESDANSVIFDHRGDQGMHTLRVSYHYEDGKFMFGDPTRVKPKVVYLNMNGDEVPGSSDAERRYEDRYGMDEQPQVPVGVKPKSPEKADPLGGLIPQEIVTARTRGYGPRRGNLERLLRYWRPIMRKPGGFRRCRVILANHPELYPLNNICAWLHHETTGLWPNEGCHHPGMKNCRKKLRGIVNGSIWNDSEFNSRLSGLVSRGRKDGFISEEDIFEVFGDQGSEEDNIDLLDVVAEKMAYAGMGDFETDDEAEEEKQAYESLREFMNAEPEFTSYMTGDDNWVIEGEDDDDETVEMPLMATAGGGKGGCGCGGSCGGGGKEMIAALAAALADMVKSAEDEMQTKDGYVNPNNVDKLKQAYAILHDVFRTGGIDEKPHLVRAKGVSVYELKSVLDPVLEYHGIGAEATEQGVNLFGIDCASEEAIDALGLVLRTLES